MGDIRRVEIKLMTKEKKQIILIYSAVAVTAVVLIFGFSIIAEGRKIKAEASEKARKDRMQAVEVVEPLTDLDKQLTEDLKGKNQSGDDVSLYGLKGKVVVFAQFYSRCSMCLGHNKEIMTDLHSELKADPNVHFVTVTVDPEFDTPEKLQEMAEIWGADVNSWWMLNVPDGDLAQYCRNQMWYVDYRENEEKTSIADAIEHDMGIAVIDGDSKMRAKVNLYELKSSGQEEMYQVKKSQLLDVIRNAKKEM